MEFFSIFMIISRETLEIIMFLFLIMNSLSNIKNHQQYVFLGFLFGVIQACLVFFCGVNLLRFFDSYDIIITFIAGFGMIYTSFWICNQLKYIDKSIIPYEGIENKDYITYHKYYIILFVGMAIMREVLEILVFVSGIVNIYKTSCFMTLLYSFISLLISLCIGIASYIVFFKRIVKLIFRFSYYWMNCFAANLLATGFEKLNAVGFINILNFKAWDFSNIIANNSILGEVLNILIGYNAIPSALGVLVYISVLLIAYVNFHTSVIVCDTRKSCKIRVCSSFNKKV